MTVNLKDKGQSLRVVTQGWLSGGAPGSTTDIHPDSWKRAVSTDGGEGHRSREERRGRFLAC